jgi:hypothetical protein
LLYPPDDQNLKNGTPVVLARPSKTEGIANAFWASIPIKAPYHAAPQMDTSQTTCLFDRIERFFGIAFRLHA